MAASDRFQTALPARVSELPGRYRAVARSFQPVIARAHKNYTASEVVRMLAAAMGEELAARPEPGASLAMALMRGAGVREQMKLSEGGSLSSEETGSKLGISKAATLNRYRKGQLLGWREAKQNAVRFPVWQFAEDNVLPGLPEVLAVLHPAAWMDDWGKIAFFLTPLASMKGKRPLDLLREGETKRVVQAAQGYLQ